ncbi:hypothetical protein ANOM_006031, partial [Aspergillus nomiae NRRL 13137]
MAVLPASEAVGEVASLKLDSEREYIHNSSDVDYYIHERAILTKRREISLLSGGQRTETPTTSSTKYPAHQEYTEGLEDDLFPEHIVSKHHMMAIRMFRKLWKQSIETDLDEDWELLEQQRTVHSHDGLPGKKPIHMFEEWLAEETDIGESLSKPGVNGQDFLSMLIRIPTKHMFTASVFNWVMWKYPNMYLMVGNRTRNPSLLAEASSMSSSINFVAHFLQDYPTQTAKMLELDNNMLLELLPVMIDRNCSNDIFANMSPAALMATDDQKNSILHLVSEYSEEEGFSFDIELRNEKRMILIHNLLTYCKSAITWTNNDNQSAYQHRIRTFHASRLRIPAVESDPSLGLGEGAEGLRDDKILTLLREKTMNLDDDEMIVSLLYGKVHTGREINLDLTELGIAGVTVTKTTVKRLVRGLKFESILKFVRIPSFSAVRPGRQNSVHNTLNQQQFAEIAHTGDIFTILWEQGVKKILSVKVDDDNDDCPYSDEMLETLKKFGIEEWDWRRTDLCSRVVLKAAGNARKITLYSTGNKAVLRSWSAPDGLNALKKLTDVQIVVQPRLETIERINCYLKEFTNRLQENRDKGKPQIKISFRFKSEDDNYSYFLSEDIRERNPWLDNMDRFVTFVKNTPEISRVVKVAVIGHGVGQIQENFEDSIISGISFSTSQYGSTISTLPWYLPSNDKSTLMAKTILRLCPNVKLYIARLDYGIDGVPTIESAIKAISWATAIGVDIISMSSTFPELRDTESRKLSEVIDEAHNNKILTFAPVTDQGFNRPDIPFPGKTPGVFRVGAARDSGVPDDLSQGYEFLFPGGSSVTNVRQREEGSTGANSAVVLGSSFATAVASGLAALILHCAELCDLGDEYGDDLRQYQNMKDIFCIMASGSPQSSYIQAEKWFPASFENKDWMEDEDQDEFRRRITAII